MAWGRGKWRRTLFFKQKLNGQDSCCSFGTNSLNRSDTTLIFWVKYSLSMTEGTLIAACGVLIEAGLWVDI